jgi:flagellar hook-basal body complex protein FliE
MTLPIASISPIPMPGSAAAGAGSGSGAFGNILENTINNLQALQNDAGSAAQKFMTGENEELHTVALAGQQAELAFELGLQVRNKVVSAYQEVMKMQL